MTTKTITITLTEEQQEIFLRRLETSTWKLSSSDHKFIIKEYKNPSEWTKEQIIRVKKLDEKLDRQYELAKDFVNQVKEQLKEE